MQFTTSKKVLVALSLLAGGAAVAWESLAEDQAQPAAQGETLYNGITLPAVWPPRNMDPKSLEPMPVPYLKNPPQVIPIDQGRQLFVDDFLIDRTDLERTYHKARKHPANPVLKPETRYELTVSGKGPNDRPAVCYLGHGGVFYDPEAGEFKMFYTAGWRGGLALATSKDMVNWERPDLKLAGENLLLPPGERVSGPSLLTAGGDNSVWYDLNAQNPQERIKFMSNWAGGSHTLQMSDGKHWSQAVLTGRAGDYCSFFYNPFRDLWVYSIKQDGPRGRSRYYSESPDFMQGADWSGSVYWTNADKLDAPEPAEHYPGGGEAPQLYSLNAVAYESLIIGMHYIHRGPNNRVCDEGNFPKLTDLELGFSRDGFHWHRPDRSGFLTGERTEGTWDRAYMHSTTGVCVVLDDQLVFPYTAYSGVAPSGARGMYTGASIGIATLRRDGFASLDAGKTPGLVVTRPVKFSGNQLFVNVAAPEGALRVAVLDQSGQEIKPFTLENCQPVTADSTLKQVQWKGAADLSALKDLPVRFQFELKNGSLYSFWVSPDASGKSAGYVASGGPGYPGTLDTVGKAALER